MVSMKPLNKCAIKNLPYYDVLFITIYGKQNNKISYEKKKSDLNHQISVIRAWKFVFFKKVVKMIMKIDVLKTGFRAKKAHYEF